MSLQGDWSQHFASSSIESSFDSCSTRRSYAKCPRCPCVQVDGKSAHMSQPIAGASEDGTSAVSNSSLPPVNQHDTGPVAGDPAVHGKSCTLILEQLAYFLGSSPASDQNCTFFPDRFVLFIRRDGSGFKLSIRQLTRTTHSQICGPGVDCSLWHSRP